MDKKQKENLIDGTHGRAYGVILPEPLDKPMEEIDLDAFLVTYDKVLITTMLLKINKLIERQNVLVELIGRLVLK